MKTMGIILVTVAILYGLIAFNLEVAVSGSSVFERINNSGFFQITDFILNCVKPNPSSAFLFLHFYIGNNFNNRFSAVQNDGLDRSPQSFS